MHAIMNGSLGLARNHATLVDSDMVISTTWTVFTNSRIHERKARLQFPSSSKQLGLLATGLAYILWLAW